MRNIKILSSGKYLPKRIVPSSEVDQLIGVPSGTVEGKSGVRERRYADNIEETQSSMAAMAIKECLSKVNLELTDIDALICTSGTSEQEIPSNAALILKALDAKRIGMTAFDINSTCMSFLSGLDTVSYMIHAERFNRVLFVSSEVASVGINYRHLESASLFGDGAVAVLVEKSDDESGIIGAQMKVYPEGADHCRILGGGSKYPPKPGTFSEEDCLKFKFEMNGKAVFKLASEVMKKDVQELLTKCDISIEQLKLIVPHQASKSGMRLIQKKLSVSPDQWMDIIETHGNMVSVSIPLALSYAIENKRVTKGDLVMLLATSAGFATGVMIIKI